jgi:hypothetical protein
MILQLMSQMSMSPGMSIRSQYLVPKVTGIAGTGTGTGTQAAVIPVPTTGKMIYFGRPVPVLPK